LWICPLVWNKTDWVALEMVQVGRETNWEATARSFQHLVALKSDGSLWKWDLYRGIPSKGRAWDSIRQSARAIANAAPTRLGIKNDWVAVAKHEEGVIPLAADGSLWYWPDKEFIGEPTPLLRPPRKPQLLANIFGPSK
jgi:alpha-tubulin suppressor-like RCC1 family protein